MRSNFRKHEPTLIEHRRLWVLVTIARAVNHEIGKVVADILPIAVSDSFRSSTGKANRLLLGVCNTFDNFAARFESKGGVPAPYDWAMHYNHNTPQGKDLERALAELIAKACARDIEHSRATKLEGPALFPSPGAE